MQNFKINGIRLSIPETCLTDALTESLRSGQYEQLEAGALRRHLQSGDRVLDLGAGAGYLSALAAKTVGAENVVAVEAGPDMIDPLRSNLDANGGGAAQVIHGAVVDDDYVNETVTFHSRRAFWASSIASDHPGKNARFQTVPAMRIGDLLREHQPSVVILDIEGGEASLFSRPWPDHVRLLIMEIHTGKYSPRVVQSVFDGVSACGMTYMPWGSRGETVVFQRVPPE